MGHYEDIKIDRSEGWKYSNTHGTSGDDYHARVYVDDKGEISKDSYSQEYNDKNGNNDKPEKPDKKGNDKKGNDKKGNDKSGNSGEKKEGCLTKIIKAPFRFLWWLIKFILKNALVILTFGIANGWFDKKDD